MSERNLTILLFVIMGVIIVGGGIALYFMRMVTLDDLETQLTTVTAQVVEAQGKKAKIKALEDEVKVLTEKRDEILQQIPAFDDNENDQYANLIDGIRKKTRVQIADHKYKARGGSGEVPMPKEIFRARYEFKATGGFFQLLNFLNHLETDRRLLIGENIQLRAGAGSEGKSGSPVRELSLTVSTFLKRMTPAAAPPPGTKPPEKPTEPKQDEPKKVSTPIPD